MEIQQIKTTGRITCDHNFSPRNEREVNFLAAIETAARFLTKILDVSVVLTVERQASWAGVSACYLGKYVYSKKENFRRIPAKIVKINMRNLYGATLEKVLTVLGHEFRHAVQLQNGIMDKGIPDTARECLEHFSYSYWNSDEEKDARKYQSVYAEMAIQDDSFEPYRHLLSDKVTGSPVIVDDYAASYAALNLDKEKEKISLFRFRDKLTGKIIDDYYWFRLKDVNGSPKRWTNKIYQRVYSEHEQMLRNQPFPVLKRELGLEEMYM